LNREWENWSITAGVRTEYTEASGFLMSDATDEINDFDYFKTFPTASISHRFNDSHSLGLSYSKRIERPTYSSLNPFKFFFNDNAFFSGNPRLQPAIAQLATLSYSINDTYTFELYYRHEDNTFSELSIQDNDLNQILYRPSNLIQEIDYGFDFILYKSFTKHWTAYVVTSVFNDKTEFSTEQSNNILQTKERWSFYGNAINYFTFLKDQSLTANISLLYISPSVSGSAEVSTRTQVDFGLKKSFNKGKWILSLSANDILLGSDYTVKNKYLNQDNQYYTRFDNQWVRLGLRYNFGNTKLSTNESIKELEERDRLNKSN
jgi:outer membrane receptor protein involved in Fe transport